GPLGARRGHRQAADRRRLGRAARGGPPRRALLPAPGGGEGTQEARAPSRGALYCLLEALKKLDKSPAGQRVAIQGFGNVGSFLAQFLHEEGAVVVAISDSGGGLYNPKGIDVPAALAFKQETGQLRGFRGADAISNEELILLDCDVLAPCALE